MTRLRDWPSRFSALVESVRARPFAWGSHDCCLWAASSVEALTGVDPAAEWRGTYASEREASVVLLRLGGLPVVGALAGCEIAAANAAPGDVGLVKWPDGTVSLGVCSGSSWLCAGEAGLVALDTTAAIRAWGVGRV